MWRRPTAIALAAGLALLALALLATLAGAPLRVARTSIADEEFEVLGQSGPGKRICQDGETLPAGTTAVRTPISVNAVGPRVDFRASAGGRTIASGSKEAGWSGYDVTIPVRRVGRTIAGATVCFATGSDDEAISFEGAHINRPGAGASSEGRQLTGRLTVEYMRPSSSSWLSHAAAVAHRIGLGNFAGGGWVALPLLACVLALAVLSSWLVLREGREELS
jgi:hypothetical protein